MCAHVRAQNRIDTRLVALPGVLKKFNHILIDAKRDQFFRVLPFLNSKFLGFWLLAFWPAAPIDTAQTATKNVALSPPTPCIMMWQHHDDATSTGENYANNTGY
jgi:hypothetical protein